jgi:hypothetical protein
MKKTSKKNAQAPRHFPLLPKKKPDLKVAQAVRQPKVCRA